MNMFIRIFFVLLAISFYATTSPIAYGTPPPGSGVVDVTKAPYFALADGVNDDTNAIQRALNDHIGKFPGTIIYLPAGKYRVTESLKYPLQLFGALSVRGDGPQATVITLDQGRFSDAGSPQAVLDTGYQPGLGADWFHNYVEDLKIEVGPNNPGAIGLRFYSNNHGGVQNVEITSASGNGLVGLDLGFVNLNGPHIVRDLLVSGFETGIKVSGGLGGQTMEAIVLRDQSGSAIVNVGQVLTILDLDVRSASSLPAVVSQSPGQGHTTIIGARLANTGGGSTQPAILGQASNKLTLRDISAVGYNRAVRDEANVQVM